MNLFIAIICGIGGGAAIGYLVASVRKNSNDSNWTNKEFDGTVFVFTVAIAFLVMIILTYLKPEFAREPTSLKILEIIKDLSLIIAGALFKRAADALTSNGGRIITQANPADQKETIK